MQNQIIDAFIPSAEMREYLKDKTLSTFDLFDIIAGSLTCLENKLYWTKKLYSKKDSDLRINNRQNKIIESLESAIKEIELQPGEIFTLTANWYDEEINEEKKSGGVPFANFSKVIEYISEEIYEAMEGLKNYDELFDTCCWYTLEKWVPDASRQNYINTYTYYLVETSVVYYRKSDSPTFESWFDGNTDINLPIPFKQGDIVSVDCRPFHPKIPALIVAVGDNSDCCCVQGLILEPDGKWSIRALKHNTFIDSMTFPMVSPLYRLSKNKEVLPDEMDLLARLAEELKLENKYWEKIRMNKTSHSFEYR